MPYITVAQTTLDGLNKSTSSDPPLRTRPSSEPGKVQIHLSETLITAIEHLAKWDNTTIEGVLIVSYGGDLH